MEKVRAGSGRARARKPATVELSRPPLRNEPVLASGCALRTAASSDECSDSLSSGYESAPLAVRTKFGFQYVNSRTTLLRHSTAVAGASLCTPANTVCGDGIMWK